MDGEGESGRGEIPRGRSVVDSSFAHAPWALTIPSVPSV